MKSNTLRLSLAAILLAFTPLAAKKAADAATRFKQKLTKPQQVEHALSRLTFGARPGDVEAVSKMGINK